jgi:hypothetical protein
MLRQREPRKRDRKYLGAIARMPSIVSGAEPVEVCHVRFGDASRGKPHTGMGEKPHDKWVMPLTPQEHRMGVLSQHANNEREWWAGFGVDPISACEHLYEMWQRVDLDESERLRRMREIVLAFRLGLMK